MKLTIKTLLFPFLLIGLAKATTNTAQTTPSNTITEQQIIETAIQHVKTLFPQPEIGTLSFAAVPIDHRIKIKPCNQPLKAKIPNKASLNKRTTVQISCDSPKHWKMYIQIKIQRIMPMVVAKSDLASGTMLSTNNLIIIMKDSSQIRGRILHQPDILYGARVSRYIRAGQPITMRQICLVCKGDNVTIIAKIKGLQIKTSGIAQQSGSLGDNIAILNKSSGKRIEAKVIAVNQVQVNI